MERFGKRNKKKEKEEKEKLKMLDGCIQSLKQLEDSEDLNLRKQILKVFIANPEMVSIKKNGFIERWFLGNELQFRLGGIRGEGTLQANKNLFISESGEFSIDLPESTAEIRKVDVLQSMKDAWKYGGMVNFYFRSLADSELKYILEVIRGSANRKTKETTEFITDTTKQNNIICTDAIGIVEEYLKPFPNNTKVNEK